MFQAGVVESTSQILTKSLLITLGSRHWCYVSSPALPPFLTSRGKNEVKYLSRRHAAVVIRVRIQAVWLESVCCPDSALALQPQPGRLLLSLESDMHLLDLSSLGLLVRI